MPRACCDCRCDRGCLAAAALLGAVAWCVWRRRRRQAPKGGAPDAEKGELPGQAPPAGMEKGGEEPGLRKDTRPSLGKPRVGVSE
jgi:hypothetical protein